MTITFNNLMIAFFFQYEFTLILEITCIDQVFRLVQRAKEFERNNIQLIITKMWFHIWFYL